MSYQLNEFVDREGTNSMKWNYREKVFGTDDVLPLWVADMDFSCPPSVTEALIERAKHPIYGYPGKPDAFFSAVVDWLKRRQNLDINQEWLTSIPGVVPGLHVAVDAFSKPGDNIIIQPPVYHPFFSTIKDKGRHVVENPLQEADNGEYYMDLDDLRSKIDARTSMLILCSPHNPLGRVWTRDELLALAQVCKENDVMIISDEIHSDLVYDKSQFTPFFSLPKEITDHGMAFIAPSKTFNLAGLFTSMAITAHPAIRQRFQTAAAKSGLTHINVFGIEALTAAYNNGEGWLEDVLAYLQANAAYIQRFLQERIPQVKMKVPDATYLGWLDFRELGLYGQALNDFVLQQARLGLNSGAMFGEQGDGFQRINFACTRSVLEEAMARLEQAVNEL